MKRINEGIAMIDELHFRKLERMYLSAPCNEYYQPQITISHGACELVIPVKRDFFHAANAVHGSVYFKALDDAAYFAVNSLVKDVFVLTVSFNVHFLRPISDGEMRALGKAFFSSRELSWGESIIYDSKDREIARGSGMFAAAKVKLSPEIGYK
jgi:uncharacterized protein (TIGR00369 family)